MSETEGLTGYSWLDGRLQYRYLDTSRSRAEAVRYYENGKLELRYPALEHKFHGICRAWYENGQVKSEEVYNQGVLDGPKSEWYPDGILESEETYKKGRINGTCRKWHKNGQLSGQSSYVKGVLHGAYKRWAENGQLEYEGSYTRGVLDGVVREWYADGRPRSEKEYRQGRLNGRYRGWADDGRLLKERFYVRGIQIGGKIYNLLKSGELNAQDILKIKNATVRRFCLEEMGYSRFLAQLEHTVIDKDGDNELVKIDWHSREEPICLVKVRCPSAGVFYTLRVPPAMKTVKAALAWTFGIRKDDYRPQIET